jgi:glutathione peroxidase
MSDFYGFEVNRIDGGADLLGPLRGKVTLAVNVASKCGLTPQYEGLEKIYEQYRDKGFTVLGFPCNQFLEQEPGTPDEIAEFCQVNYGVQFPIFEKIDVNGDGKHPLYAELEKTADAEGHDGDIRWNFEKFLVDADGSVVARFSPQTEPEDPALISAIEGALP